ncbi:MAG: flagellar biosynthetic protein FliQ [Proteobacteria bacterium]|nr:MAG: flagellar biosynthetic protein FliQ [Pseudomonadota bacterium]
MTEKFVLDIAWNTIMITMKVAAPALLATLVIGLLVSIFQAATQINEQNLVFIPKMLAMTATVVVAGPWILRLLITFTIDIFKQIPQITH